mgnify:FL=1
MKRKKRPNLNQQKTTLIIVVAIAIVVMLAYSFHENNVKNYNYIKESWFENIIYTSYYDDRNEYIKEVPYINIKGEQITEVNNQIETFSTKYTNLSRAIITYDYSITGQILSVIIKAINYETNYASEAEFISYNINLKTQQVYTNQEILDLYNINAGYVSDRIKNQLQQYHKDIIKEKYYSLQQCNFTCFLKWRNIEDYSKGIAYYISAGKLYVYKPFVFASIFGEEEYFKDKHFVFLITEKPIELE